MRLVEEEEPLLAEAVARGAAGEDDSEGYALSNDPKTRAVEEAMRRWAMKREGELGKVLATSSEVKDRRAAAVLMGYVKRSGDQVEALTEAMRDPDDEVRNNAARALAVLASARKGESLQVDLGPLIDLLYSGVWTDRNKVSLLLLRLTTSRNVGALRTLRKEALGPLAEGAMWKDVPGHSTPFAVVVGRIGGLSDERIFELLKRGDAAAIVAAAKAAKD
jgi:HEAT repeat protein